MLFLLWLSHSLRRVGSLSVSAAFTDLPLAVLGKGGPTGALLEEFATASGEVLGSSWVILASPHPQLSSSKSGPEEAAAKVMWWQRGVLTWPFV